MRARPASHARVNARDVLRDATARLPGTETAETEDRRADAPDAVGDAPADLDEGRPGVPEGVGAKVTREASALGAATFASSRPPRRTVAPAVASTSWCALTGFPSDSWRFSQRSTSFADASSLNPAVERGIAAGDRRRQPGRRGRVGSPA
jgi:hypothetical protein